MLGGIHGDGVGDLAVLIWWIHAQALCGMLKLSKILFVTNLGSLTLILTLKQPTHIIYRAET